MSKNEKKLVLFMFLVLLISFSMILIFNTKKNYLINENKYVKKQIISKQNKLEKVRKEEEKIKKEYDSYESEKNGIDSKVKELKDKINE